MTGTNDGTMANAESIDLVTNTPCGFNNFSLSFDGVDETTQNGTVSMLNGATNVSLSYWVKVPDSTIKIPIGTYTSAANAFFCQLNLSAGKSLVFNIRNGSTTDYAYSNPIIAIGVWYHIGIAYDGSLSVPLRTKMWVDGVAQTVAVNSSVPASLGTNTTTFDFGGLSNLSLYYPCQVDEPALFDYTLTNAEMIAIYNSGVPNDLMALTDPKKPEHYWRMGDDDTYPTISDVGATGTNDGTMINQEILDINGNVPLENN